MKGKVGGWWNKIFMEIFRMLFDRSLNFKTIRFEIICFFVFCPCLKFTFEFVIVLLCHLWPLHLMSLFHGHVA